MQKKRNKILIIIFIILIILIGGLYFANSKGYKVSLKSIIPSVEPIITTSVKIQTTPSGATIKLDGNLKQSSPFTEPNVALGHHTITAELEGYISSTKVINIEPTDSEVTTINIELYKKPEPSLKVSDKSAMRAHTFNLQDGSENYIVYVEPFSRKFVIKKGDVDFGLFPEQLHFIEQIFWLDNDKAVVINGKLLKDKVAYLVDFSPWHKKEVPTLRQLSQIGVAFTLGPTPNQLAFLGNLDTSISKSEVGIIDLNNNQVKYIPNIEIIGGRKVYWMTENLIYVVAEPVESYPSVEPHSERVIYKLEKKAFEWQKTTLDLQLSQALDINTQTQTLGYINEGNIHLLNLVTGLEHTYELNTKDYSLEQEAIPVLVYSENFLIYAYQTNSKNIVVKYVDMENNEEGTVDLGKDFVGRPTELYSVGEDSFAIVTNRDRYYTYNFKP